MIAPWLTVLTTPSRPEYLIDTLASIDAAGGARFRGKRIVFVDGAADQAPDVPAGWTKQTTGVGPRGTRRALWTVLHLAALSHVDHLLYFEDDVRLCRNAITAMSLIKVPTGVAFLAFLNQRADVRTNAGIECRRADDPAKGERHWGNQALKIPERSLRRFLNRWTEPIGGWAFASDVWLGQQLATKQTADHFYGIFLPALVRHVGARTLIPTQEGQTLDGHRGGLNYPGDHFDALTTLATAHRVSHF